MFNVSVSDLKTNHASSVSDLFWSWSRWNGGAKNPENLEETHEDTGKT